MSAGVDYFAYGSNLHPGRLAARAPSCRFVCIAELPRHRMAFHKRSLVDGSGKCNIVSAAADRVHGVVYRLNRADMQSLDTEEVVHGGYQRHDFEVITSDYASLKACAYLAPATLIEDGLAPFDWYHALVLAGALHHGLPGEYIDVLRRVRCVRDTDSARRRRYDVLLKPAG